MVLPGSVGEAIAKELSMEGGLMWWLPSQIDAWAENKFFLLSDSECHFLPDRCLSWRKKFFDSQIVSVILGENLLVLWADVIVGLPLGASRSVIM